jgi:hypothetical protein
MAVAGGDSDRGGRWRRILGSVGIDDDQHADRLLGMRYLSKKAESRLPATSDSGKAPFADTPQGRRAAALSWLADRRADEDSK